MPWQLIEGVGPGLDPIIKRVKNPKESYMVINQAVTELMNNTDVSLRNPITIVVGSAVYDDLDQAEKDYMASSNIRLLESKYIRYDQVVVM